MIIKTFSSLIIFLNVVNTKASTTNASKHEEGIKVVGFEIHEMSKYLLVVCFVLIAAIIKVIYHHLHKLASYLPESCLLMIIGIITGLIIRYGFPQERNAFSLTPEVFFFVYLPPIVLESSFSLYHRNFGDNLGTILIFAVLGTLANFLIIGFCLYGLGITAAMGFPKLGLSMKECLLFSSFIVAVDPVAVLAIFEDIGVCKDLYFTVFGESLLNDAVTVVLYDIMVAFLVQTNIDAGQIGLGIARFFTVSLGGLLIGLFVGVLCCLLTRVTYSSKTVEPLIILLMGYLSYILGDLFTWSGIISMIGCGLVQAAYAFHNISNKSLIIVKRGCKMIASVSEAVIFMFLGIEVVTENLIWHTGFILWSLVICLLSRGMVILAICGIINWFRVDLVKISFTEQFILVYGGLRGAVAFSLALLVKNNLFSENGEDKRNLFITATLGIIIFTVMIMGTTMKPLVKLLHIRMAKASKLSITQEMHESVEDHLLAGIEAISGAKGRNNFRNWFIHINDKYIKKVLQRNPECSEPKLLKTYEKVCLAFHYASINPARSEHYLDKLSENFNKAHERSTENLKLSKQNSKLSLFSDDSSMKSDDENSDDENKRETYRRQRRITLADADDETEIKAALHKQRRRVSHYMKNEPEFDNVRVKNDPYRDLIKKKKMAVKTARRISCGTYAADYNPVNDPRLVIPDTWVIDEGESANPRATTVRFELDDGDLSASRETNMTQL